MPSMAQENPNYFDLKESLRKLLAVILIAIVKYYERNEQIVYYG